MNPSLSSALKDIENFQIIRWICCFRHWSIVRGKDRILTFFFCFCLIFSLDNHFNVMLIIASSLFFCMKNMSGTCFYLSLLILVNLIPLHYCGTANALFLCLSLLQSLWPCRQSPAGCWDKFFIAASVSTEKIFWKMQFRSWVSACWVAWLNRRIDSAKFLLFGFFFFF